MRPATVSRRETLLEKMSLEHNRLGTDESLYSRVFQSKTLQEMLLMTVTHRDQVKTLVHAGKTLYKCK